MFTDEAWHEGPKPIDVWLPSPEYAVVRVEGRLDEAAGMELCSRVALALEVDVTGFELDLGRVEELDRDGLHALLEVDRHIRAAGATITVTNAPPVLAHTLHLARDGRPA